jgi:hypothetical protein
MYYGEEIVAICLEDDVVKSGAIVGSGKTSQVAETFMVVIEVVICGE